MADICYFKHEWREPAAIVTPYHCSLDLSTASDFESALYEVLDQKPRGLVVDLTLTEFLASAGVTVLLRARDRSVESGIRFAVVADSMVVYRPLEVLGLTGILNVKSSQAEAMDVVNSIA